MVLVVVVLVPETAARFGDLAPSFVGLPTKLRLGFAKVLAGFVLLLLTIPLRSAGLPDALGDMLRPFLLDFDPLLLDLLFPLVGLI